MLQRNSGNLIPACTAASQEHNDDDDDDLEMMAIGFPTQAVLRSFCQI